MSANNSAPLRGLLQRCGAVALSVVLCSCAAGPNFARPSAPPVTHYAFRADPTVTDTAQGTAQHFAPGAMLADNWWQLFNSAKLDTIVGDALARNAGLAAAQASLRQSEDSLRSGYGIFFPQIDADASATRQRYAPVKLGQHVPSAVFNLFTLSASVSYALDIFGGERRLIEALRAQVDLQRASEQATHLILASNIVNTVIARAAYGAEIEAAQQLVELQREQVGLAEIQAQAGIVPYSNVLSLQSQLASYQATIPPLQQRLAQSEDLLATLAGYVPAEWSAPEIGLADLTLPSDLPVSLASELVRQRPDILMAEATSHAASAYIGVATAALLPSFTLNGSYSANGLSAGSLMSASGRAWSVGADATAPLFQGGTLWFKRKAAIDNYQLAAALYRETVLAAFAQVADALRALDDDAAALNAQDAALQTAKEALHLIQTNYQAGLSTYLDVLNADAQYHLAAIADLQTTALRYQDTVALFAALGGGWSNAADSAGADPRAKGD
jgi:NodT family efflux transporter outer membrane factor (OMF) lipoprotein